MNGLTEVFGRKLDASGGKLQANLAWENSRFLCGKIKEEADALKPFEAFASRFGSKIIFNPELIVEKNQRFYLLIHG